MPITESDLAGLSGGNVVTTSGDKIGSIGQIYLDDQTGEPSFVAANTGLLGMSLSLIPLRDATIRDGDVVVGYDKDMVTNAPPLGDDEDGLSRGQEQKLYDYYGISYDVSKTDAAWPPAEVLDTTSDDATTGTTGHPERPDDAPATTDR
jgi:sporulation protein YlmC with PRC-barrel domain